MQAGFTDDLDTLVDFDSTLQRIGDVTIKREVAHYFYMLHVARQLRAIRWFALALFITAVVELGVKTIFPSDTSMQTLLVVIIGGAVVSALWLLEYSSLAYGGNPADLFISRDDERPLLQGVIQVVQAQQNRQHASLNAQAIFDFKSDKESHSVSVYESPPPINTAAVINTLAPHSPFSPAVTVQSPASSSLMRPGFGHLAAHVARGSKKM